jgi:hypothetical protein
MLRLGDIGGLTGDDLKATGTDHRKADALTRTDTGGFSDLGGNRELPIRIERHRCH